MGKHTFNDILSKIKYHTQHQDSGYNFPLLPMMNETVGNITNNGYTVIGGMSGSGRTAFINQNYVIGPLLQWYFDEDRESHPLKIFYFSTTNGELKVIQSLLCLYLRLVHNIIIDIPTLNSQPGRLYDLSKKAVVRNAIESSKPFFDTILKSGVLEIIEGFVQPSKVYNTCSDYMENSGSINSIGKFELDPEFQNLTMLNVVDSVDHLLSESDKFSTAMYGEDLDRMMDGYLIKLERMYGVHSIVSTLSRVKYARTVKDYRPHYKHLGIFGQNCHIGIEIYGPNKEGDTNYIINDADKFVSPSSKMDTLRMWKVVRHSSGPDFRVGVMGFNGTNGFFTELNPEEITGFPDVKVLLGQFTEYTDLYNDNHPDTPISITKNLAPDKLQERQDTEDVELLDIDEDEAPALQLPPRRNRKK